MIRLSVRQRRYLGLLGLPRWQLREQALPLETPEMPAQEAGQTHAFDPACWQEIQAQVSACEKCPLHQTRTKTVFGSGNTRAQWMFVGEAPGADEDRQGEPFVGRAGQLLTSMLQALALTRDDVYIANIMKCRPPRNRDPLPTEVAQCEPFLQRQLAMIRPKIIVALGRVAAQNLLKTDETIGVMRGRRFYYGELEIPLVVTYHPAYLLRTPKDKRKVWQDLCLAKSVLQQQEKM